MPVEYGFMVTCDICRYTIEEDESEISVYDSKEVALATAEDNGWKVTVLPGGETVLCPECKGIR